MIFSPLSDEKFNTGLFGTWPGERRGAVVEATVTQIQAIPLPAAGWMGLMLLGGLATARRLRRKS